MDRRQGFAALAAAAVLASAGAWWALDQGPAPVATTVPQAQPAFPGIATRLASAARIEVKGPDASLVLLRQGAGADAGWAIESKAGFPAKLDRVREVLAGLSELVLSEPRTANPELLERLGLEDPARPGAKSLLLTVRDAQGSVLAELVVGRRRVRVQGNVPEAVYVRRPAETQAWLAEGNLRVDADPLLWAERDLVDVKRARVARIEGGAGEDAFALARGSASDPWALRDAPEGPPLDPEKADDLARALEWFAFNDVRAAATLAAAPPSGRFVAHSFDGLTVAVEVRRHDGKVFALVEPSAGPDAAPEVQREAATLTARTRGFAFEIADWKAETLLAGRTSLLKQPEPAPESEPTETGPAEATPTEAPPALPQAAEPPKAEPPS